MFSQDIYSNRRDALARLLPDSFLLFIGNKVSPMNYHDNTFPFRQDSTFLYLFGLDVPDMAAIIDTATGVTTIFADDVSMDDIIWTGPMPSVADLASLCGVVSTRPLDALPNAVSTALRQHRKVHFVNPYRAETIVSLSALTGIPVDQVCQQASVPLMKALVSLRSSKQQCEIDEMDRHMHFGVAMHLTAMHLAHDGVSENQVMAALEHQALLGGGLVSFPTISTVNGQTLHNHGYSHTLRNGDLLLVDAGCESPNHYATDNTRTSPVGGRFSARQKEVYQAVLDANEAVIAQARPGVLYRDMHFAAARAIVDALKSIGLMSGDTDDAIQQGAYALFMPHGIGHMLGLDVHDMENYGEELVGYDDEVQRSSQFGLASLRMARRLQPGFCVTDEPGIYFIPQLIDRWRAEHKCDDFINYARLESYKDFGGIRIEDDLLITPDGCRIIGQRLPAAIADVEAEVQKGLHSDAPSDPSSPFVAR